MKSILVAFILLASSISHARSIHVTLAAPGEYRIGQFVRLPVAADEPDGRDETFVLRLDGALPTRVHLAGQSSAQVPVLMLASSSGALSIDANQPAIQLPLELSE